MRRSPTPLQNTRLTHRQIEMIADLFVVGVDKEEEVLHLKELEVR